jgi:hypothetical protein
MSESTNASNTGCADKVRLCLFIARRNGHTAVGDYVEVECKNESLQLVPNCKHVQMPSDICSCCAAATVPSSSHTAFGSLCAYRSPTFSLFPTLIPFTLTLSLRLYFPLDQCGNYFVGVADGTGTRFIKIAVTADILMVRSLIYEAPSQAFGSNQLTQPHIHFRTVL